VSSPFFLQRGAIRGGSPINYGDDNIRVFLVVEILDYVGYNATPISKSLGR
jgi:hypothetical protein